MDFDYFHLDFDYFHDLQSSIPNTILGGIDVDFICRVSPDTIIERCEAMLARVQARGGYALGSGNSIPAYMPDEHYFAMLSTVTDMKY